MSRIKIQRDARVEATDGEVGRVKHVIVDPDTREVTELVVGRDDQEWLISIAEVADTAGDTVKLRGDRARFEATGGFERDAHRPVDGERAQAESRRQARRGGAPLHKAGDDAVVIDTAGGRGMTEQPAARPARAARAHDVPNSGGEERTLRLRAEERDVEVDHRSAPAKR